MGVTKPMTKRLRLISPFLIFIIISSLLVACNSQTTSPTIALVKVEPTFTPAPNAGSIKGVIYIEQNGKYLPLKTTDLYLAKIMLSPSGVTGVAGLDVNSDPRASTDDKGAFLFQNIPAGKYGIILYLVTHAFLMDQTDKEASMIITVVAGKTTDLGDLKYKKFPITPVP
jgi:hypothetical protein